jgi:hypothetical protein
MKKFLLILPIFFFLNSAQAYLNGNWIGWAYWRFQGDGPKCAAEIAFSENAKNFSSGAGYIDCTYVVMDIDKKVFTKDDNGNLLMNNQIVGTWSANKYEWMEQYNDKTFIHVRINREGGHMDYLETWYDEATVLYEIEGRLFNGSGG